MRVVVVVQRKRLRIPVKDTSLPCSWLLEEASKRASDEKVKLVKLQTRDGCDIGLDDAIEDAIDEGEEIVALRENDFAPPTQPARPISSNPRGRVSSSQLQNMPLASLTLTGKSNPNRRPNRNQGSSSSSSSSCSSFTAVSSLPTVDGHPMQVTCSCLYAGQLFSVQLAVCSGHTFRQLKQELYSTFFKIIISECRTAKGNLCQAKSVLPENRILLYHASGELQGSIEAQDETLERWHFDADMELYALLLNDQNTTGPASSWTSVFHLSTSWQPSVPQTEKSLNTFLATTYCVLHAMKEGRIKAAQVLGHLRRLTAFQPACHSLYRLSRRSLVGPCGQLALAEAFYGVGRHIVPPSVDDDEVFSLSREIWGFLIKKATTNDADKELYKRIDEIDASMANACQRFQLQAPNGDPFISPPLNLTKAQTMITNKTVLVTGTDGVTQDMVFKDKLTALLIKGNAATPTAIVIWDPPSSSGDNLGENQYSASPERMRHSAPALCGPHHTIKLPEWPSIEAAANAVDILSVVPSLSLKSGSAPLLTWYEDGTLAIFTQRVKNVDASCELLSPIKRANKTIDPDTLAQKTQYFAVSKNTAPCLDKRACAEAIVVLLDISISMGSRFNDQTRLEVAKRLMDAFSNRSKAYDLPHNIGLTLFGSKVHCAMPLTRLFNDFEAHVQQAKPSGCTALFDALEHAKQQLVIFRGSHPKAKLRVLCLSDGEDTQSTSQAHTVCAQLQANSIIVDSVLIGGADNFPLKAICTATGGFCFKPEESAQLLKIFEMETVLSATERDADTCPIHDIVTSESNLMKYANQSQYAFTVAPKRKKAPLLDKPGTLAQKALDQYSAAPPAVTAGVASKKRILKELARYHKNPHPCFKVYPSCENIRFWLILMEGSEGTPYEGGVFLLYAQFPQDYPTKPPQLRFATSIYHCNVNSDGRICHSIFDRNWSDDTSFRTIVDCVYGLLLAPEPNDPLDSTLAEEFFADRQQYEANAVKHTAQYASRTMASWKKEILGQDWDESEQQDDDSSAPKEYVDPISLSVMSDPVTTPTGVSYERSSIESWILQNGTDPLTSKPLKSSQLVPNLSLREAIKRWSESRKRWYDD
eukprot:m.197600 g.197600  ORF g.197600 m.197600 type:complete len:1101 (+) comp25879_c0_seq3:125-3427(+)